jgi:putative heme-binding domain-containing protein
MLLEAGPLELPHLLGPFEKSTASAVGRKLVAALEKSSGLTALPPGTLDRVLHSYPPDVRTAADGLRQRLQADAPKQQARLAELEPLLSGGDADRGRLVFFGAKAACGVCHSAEKRGGRIGPDLGSIGAIRSGRDLLEAVIFPSSSFARGFEPYVVETRQGVIQQGILARETTDALYLLTADRTEARVSLADIDVLMPGRVSIMPQGLDTQLSRQELRDLLAYLQGLR